MTETDREAFEAWVRSEYFWSISWEPDGTLYVRSEGLSQQAEAAAAFDAWRAAAAHAREQVRELVEAVEERGSDDWSPARYTDEREGIVRCGHCGCLPDDDHAGSCVYALAAKLQKQL